MNTATINTHRLHGLDYRIWLTMGLSSLLCLGFLLFQNFGTKTLAAATCPALPLSVDGKQKPVVVCPPQRLIIFTLDAPKEARVEWDFDDGTATASGASVQHKFLKEGRYTVEARFDGRCTQTVDVVVKETIGETVKSELQIFSDSAKAMVGSRLHFSAASFPAAKTYQWLVEGTGEKAEGENASFVFARPGTFTVRLTADNDPARQSVKQIVISDLPLPPPNPMQANPPGGLPDVGPLLPPGSGGNGGAPPGAAGKPTEKPAAAAAEAPKPKATEIDPEAFKGFLQQVLNGNNPINSLDAYLPYKETTQVFEEGERNSVSLKEFCAKNKKRTVESLRFNRDDQKNSVQSIVVKLKSRGLWKKIFGKG